MERLKKALGKTLEPDEAKALFHKVYAPAELKKCLIEILTAMPDKGDKLADLQNTHSILMYILKVLDYPELAANDLQFLNERSNLARKTRDAKNKLVAILILGMTPLAAIIVNYLSGLIK